MPIVGPVAAGNTTTLGTTTSVGTIGEGCTFTANVVLPPREPWWHSTVFTSAVSPTPSTSLPTQSVPFLTSIFTYPTECVDRWMLSPLPACANSRSGATAVGNRTVFSIDPAKSIVSDPIYKSCQPYSTPVYSPGVCPNGHTVAEVTAYQSSVPTGFRTFWQASCCKSGMTVGPEYPLACISYIATPLVARDTPGTATRTLAAAAASDSVLAQPSPAISSVATPTASNLYTITSGVAIADPIVVAWQVDDLTLFPTDYTKSLAQMGITANSAVSGTGRVTINSQTPDNPGGLSTGAKAGIGVGVALGLVALGIILGFFLIRKRRKNVTLSNEPVIPEMEDQDQDHAGRKWFFGGKWRNEIHAEQVQNELDSKTVHVVQGPPAELAGSVPQARTEHHDVGVEGDQSATTR